MKPQHHSGRTTAAHEKAAHDLPTQIRHFMEAHQPAFLGAGVAILLVLTVLFVVQRRERQALQAAEELGRARVTEDFEDIIDRFGRTPAASLAMLQVARRHYETGAIQRALDMYEQFLRDHANHPLATTAILGRLHCHEAMGRLNEALRGFNEFMEEHRDHPLRPQAVLGKARCLLAMGEHDQARIVYEDFIALNPESRWLPQAEQGLRELQRQLRRLSQPQAGDG